eukprot:Skav215430  [mRNA]  locus=scaffold745:208469:209554:+ [translate_table: standard]
MSSVGEDAKSSEKTDVKKLHWTQKMKLRNTELETENQQLKTLLGQSSASPAEQGADDAEGNGGDDDGDDDDSSDDSSNPDDDDFDPCADNCLEKYMTIHIRVPFAVKKYPPHMTFDIMVKKSWKTKTISYLMFQKLHIPIRFQTYANAKGEGILLNLTINQNQIVPYDTLTLSLGLRGGGKRAKPHTSEPAGSNIVAGMCKDDSLRTLEDTVGMVMLRCQNNANASPAINAVCHKMWNLIANCKGGNFKMCDVLDTLSMENLEKLQGITTSSTKVPERVKQLSSVLFAQDVDNIAELAKQTDMVKSAMVHSIQFALMKEYSDESGTIAWLDFIKTVNKVKEAKVESNAKRQQTPPPNGLGM